MLSTSILILAASSIAFGAPISRRQEYVKRTAYQVYGGDGSESQGWPAQSNWMPFDKAWDANADMMTKSCSQFGQTDDSQTEIQDIKKAIESVAGESKLPKEFLLAVMMQESKGCVRAPTTNYGQNNPGLMQSFNGAASCYGKDSCDSTTITSMIKEGAGIGPSFGLMQALEQGSGNFYKAARIYNSGSVAAGGNLGAGIATHCYASDIANRLMGWADETTQCQEGTIGSISGSTGNGGNGGGNGNGNTNPQPSSTAAPTTTAAPSSTAPASSAPAASSTGYPTAPPTTENPSPPVATEPTDDEPAPTQPTTEQPSNDDSAPKIQEKADCKSWFTVKKNDNCSNIDGVSFETLRQLNPMIDENCSNLWLGYQYCKA